MNQDVKPRFSIGFPEEQGLKDLASLQKPSGRWSICANGMGLERGFKFKGFKNAWEFMNMIAAEAIRMRHHPEWSNIYNTVFVRLTTHSPAGLSSKDIIMARFCDEKAQEIGELMTKADETSVDTGIELIDNLGAVAKDCCVPKSR